MNHFENRFMIRHRQQAQHKWRMRALTGLACGLVGVMIGVIVVAWMIGAQW